MRPRIATAYLFVMLVASAATLLRGDDDVLTFFATSDSHYRSD